MHTVETGGDVARTRRHPEDPDSDPDSREKKGEICMCYWQSGHMCNDVYVVMCCICCWQSGANAVPPGGHPVSLGVFLNDLRITQSQLN